MVAISYGDSVCLYFSDGHVLVRDAPFAIGTAADTFDLADAEQEADFFTFVNIAKRRVIAGAAASHRPAPRQTPRDLERPGRPRLAR
jgi:hypothetical protein